MFNNIFKKNTWKSHTVTLLVVAFFSLMALLAAFQLSIDKILLLEHPEAALSCSVNSVINCASVMKTPQASLLGFPNSFLGLMAYPVFFFLAFSALLGVVYGKVVLRIVYLGAFGAFVFALWLFFDSVYVIQILCPWCLLTTLSTTLIFAGLTRIALQENILNFSHKTNKIIQRYLASQYDVLAFAVVVVILALFIVLKFGDALLR